MALVKRVNWLAIRTHTHTGCNTHTHTQEGARDGIGVVESKVELGRIMLKYGVAPARFV